MNLQTYYQQQCQQGNIQPDPEQLAALAAFQVVFDALQQKKSSGLLRLRKPKPVQGLYLWGGVGIGKTLLMDCFFNCLPFPQKLRLHFHAFMQKIHQELRQLQGSKNPMQIIAKDFAKKYRVICFDEFVVSDIVDAMLLARLLQALVQEGICFVTTSNSAPDDLYKNGLQRTSFLPAIDLIKQHMRVLHLASRQDYRLLQLKKTGVYFTPDDAKAEADMADAFERVTHGHELMTDPLIIHDREIPFIKRTHEVIWFDFNVLCNIPRSQQDYLALVAEYKIIFLSHVPVLNTQSKNNVHLFVRLIDVVYDAQTALICSAATEVSSIFAGLTSMPDAVRTESRLHGIHVLLKS